MKRIVLAAAAGISFAFFSATAQDKVLLKSGKQARCEVLEYNQGKIKLETPSGKVQTGSMSAVEHIDFRTLIPFNSDLPLEVYTVSPPKIGIFFPIDDSIFRTSPEKRLRETAKIGRTPAERPLQIRNCATWMVEPGKTADETNWKALRKEIRAKDIRGLELPIGSGSDDLVHLAGVKELRYIRHKPELRTSRYLSHLVKLPGLRYLNLIIEDDTPVKKFADIEHLKNLRALYLRQASDKHLRHLKALRNLRILRIRLGHNVTQEGLNYIADLENLRELVLRKVNITDKELTKLKPLKNLRVLRLSRMDVAGAGLRALQSLDNLQALSLRHTSVTGEDLQRLFGMRKLHTLDLYGTDIKDQAIMKLTSFKKLRVLNVGRTKITGRNMNALKGLRRLYLRSSRVSNRGIDSIAELKHLKLLDLQNARTRVTDKGMRHLKNLTSLQALDISGTNVTDKGLMYLRGLENLKRIAVETTDTTKKGRTKLLSAIPGLDFVGQNDI